MGKALSGDTPILTIDGFKTMKDIKIGDQVYTENGTPTVVLGKTDIMLNREVYDITFDNGETIVADSEHLWNVIDPEYPEMVTMVTNTLYDRVIEHKNTGNLIKIEKSKKIDFDYREVEVSVTDFHFTDDIPDEYIYNDESIRMVVLSKIMNDGTISHHDSSFIRKAKTLLSTLGISFSEEINSDVITLTINDDNTHAIINVECSDSSVPVYCIEVDNPTHMFLVGNTLIPTHNCVMGNTMITIRNKNTGEVKTVSFKDFHEDNI